MSQSDSTTTNLSFRITDAEKMRLNEIAMQRSEPGDRVYVAELAREAIRQYIEKLDDDPEAVAPRERGALGAENDETGVA